MNSPAVFFFLCISQSSENDFLLMYHAFCCRVYLAQKDRNQNHGHVLKRWHQNNLVRPQM